VKFDTAKNFARCKERCLSHLDEQESGKFFDCKGSWVRITRDGVRSRGVEKRRVRVLVAKPGLDGHDRGAKVVAAGLRDAGFEVIYTGLHRTVEEIVEAAVQEDVDVVGLSILSGAHMTLVPKTVRMLRERGLGDVLVLVGGIIPLDDANELKKQGWVDEVFLPGTEIGEIVAFIEENLREKSV